MFKNKILLITGGTGSFGSTVLRKFNDLEFDEIQEVDGGKLVSVSLRGLEKE